MYLTTTLQDADGRNWLLVRETTGWRDVLAAVLEDAGCHHRPGAKTRCIIEPPTWTYWIGGHYRYSLGGLLWVIGQRTSNRVYNMPEVIRYPIDQDTLINRFWWLPSSFGEDA